MELLSDNEVLSGVRDLVGRSRIRYKDHAEDRMIERGYTRHDVQQCLMRGRFTERPFLANRSGPLQYKFTVRAMVDGRSIDVAAALYPDQNVLVITVIDPIAGF